MSTASNDPLLQPFQLKHLRLKNRLMITAHEPATPTSENSNIQDRNLSIISNFSNVSKKV